MAKINPKPVRKAKVKSQKTKVKKDNGKENPTALITAQPLPKGELQFIAINKIVTSSTNPRFAGRPDLTDEQKIKELMPALQELADSIAIQGLIEPVNVRPVNGKYELMAGERRYLAHKLLGLKEISAIVREIKDDQMLLVQIIENLQREGIHPLDEATGYQALISKGYAIKQIAKDVGKSDEYISQRLKLVDLSAPVVKAYRENNMLLEHAKLISRCSPADQKNAMEFVNSFEDEQYMYDEDDAIRAPSGKVIPTPAFLKSWIRENTMLELAKVNFDTADPQLLEVAGACTYCHKRTGFNKPLFSDMGKEDLCTDAACFNKKYELHIANQVDKIKADGYKPVLLSDQYRPAKKELCGTNDFKIVKKKCGKEKPGIYMEGPERGKVINVCVDKECEEHWPVAKPEKKKQKEPDGFAGTNKDIPVFGSFNKPAQDPDERYDRKLEIIAEKERGDMVEALLPEIGKINFTDGIKLAVAKLIFRKLSYGDHGRFLESREIKFKSGYSAEYDAFDKWIETEGLNLDGVIIELTLYLGISFNRDGILRNQSCTAVYDIAKDNCPEFGKHEAMIRTTYDQDREKALASFKRIQGRLPKSEAKKRKEQSKDGKLPIDYGDFYNKEDAVMKLNDEEFDNWINSLKPGVIKEYLSIFERFTEEYNETYKRIRERLRARDEANDKAAA